MDTKYRQLGTIVRWRINIIVSTLEGKKVSETYKDLLQISNNNQGIDTTIRYIEDGEGTPSVLGLSDTHVSVNGNVGIGTASPSATLDVQGDVIFNDPSSSLTSLFSSGAGGVYLNLNANNGSHVISYEGGEFSINDSSASTERMRIDSDGNVGIGTTTPGTKLEVSDSGQGVALFKSSSTSENAVSFIAIESPSATSNGRTRICADGDDLFFSTSNGAQSPNTSVERMRIDTSGNVGIGTTSPDNKLVVNANSENFGITVNQTSGNNPSRITFVNNEGDGQIDTNNGLLRFGNFTAEDMVIDSNGNVGIGTSSPGATLHVKADDDSENALAFWVVDKTHTNSIISAYENGDVRLGTFTYEDATGYVGIGTTNPSHDLCLGSATSTGTTDKRLKIFRGADDSNQNLEMGYKSITVTRGNILENSQSTFSIKQKGTDGERIPFHIGTNGYVGISVTDPKRALEVQSESTGIVLRGRSPDGINVLDIRKTDTGNTQFVNTHYTGGTDGNFSFNADVDIAGNISKSSGTFKIDHPLPEKSETHHLVHSFLESPQADNIYRGKIELVAGKAEVNIDSSSGMSDGTFVTLNRDIQIFTSNESDWDAVRGKVEGNKVIIECQNAESTATVSWLVIGERQDEHIRKSSITDDNGKLIVEPLKPDPEPEFEEPVEEVTVSLGGSVSIGASISGQALTELSDSRAEETAE